VFLDYGLELLLQLFEPRHLVGLALVATALEGLHLIDYLQSSALFEELFVVTVHLLLELLLLLLVPLLLALLLLLVALLH
jgi:hypothetical protein